MGGTTLGAGGSAARFTVIAMGLGLDCRGTVLAVGGGAGVCVDDEEAGAGLDELEAKPCSLASRFKRIYAAKMRSGSTGVTEKDQYPLCVFLGVSSHAGDNE